MIEIVWRALYDSVVVGTVVTAAAFATARWCAAASTRHSIWLLALIIAPAASVIAAVRAATVTIVAEAFATAPAGLDYRTSLVIAWSLIALFLLVRIGVRVVALQRLKRAAIPNARLQALVHEIDSGAGVRVAVADGAAAPMFAGLFTSAILMPPHIVAMLDDDALRQLLRHELAHAARRDDWSRLVQLIAGALLFFHPAVLLASRRVDFERELACDEAAVAGGDAESYVDVVCRAATLAAPLRPSVAVAASAANAARRMRLLLTAPPSTPRCSLRSLALAALVLIAASLGVQPFFAVRVVVATPQIIVNDAEAAEHFGRGFSLFYSGNYEESIAEYKRSFAMGYETSSSARSIAAAYASLGDSKHAVEWEARAR